jgi:hypothetical protein
MLFFGVDLESIKVIKALEEFKCISRADLMLFSKSEAFFSGVQDNQNAQILELIGFKEGHLPVRYLGGSVLFGTLRYQDCKPLLDKIVGRIPSWTSKMLSFAGRLQLIQSVLFSIQVYWSNVFIVPKKVVKAIEQAFNNFLWKGVNSSNPRAKVF